MAAKGTRAEDSKRDRHRRGEREGRERRADNSPWFYVIVTFQTPYGQVRTFPSDKEIHD